MFPSIRSESAPVSSLYQSHPSGLSSHLDGLNRLDTNENPPGACQVSLKQTLARAYVEDMQANRYPDGNHGSLKEAIASYVSE
jgi:histidinol-phosphate aminotransferase